MADVNFLNAALSKPRSESNRAVPPLYDLIELFFFAYRDFVADPDHALEVYGFGRAHHRVLHFVDRNPDLTVAELLDILRITKQSLARVLKELIDQGFILQREGREDRRQRLLATTHKGHQLASELAATQSQRIASALAEAGLGSREGAERFLFAMVNPAERAAVERLIRGNSTGGEEG
jgi:DNA-binding MarR family transcriptional regulator